MSTVRRAPLELAVDLGTAMALGALLWCGGWALLAQGWRAGIGMAALAMLTIALDRLLRTTLCAASIATRLVAGLALAATVTAAVLGGSGWRGALLP